MLQLPVYAAGFAAYITLKSMITNASSARAVSESAEVFIQTLQDAFEEARTSLPADEFEKLKKAVGTVVGTLEVDLLWPLYKRHPDLEPENLRNWETRS